MSFWDWLWGRPKTVNTANDLRLCQLKTSEQSVIIAALETEKSALASNFLRAVGQAEKLLTENRILADSVQDKGVENFNLQAQVGKILAEKDSLAIENTILEQNNQKLISDNEKLTEAIKDAMDITPAKTAAAINKKYAHAGDCSKIWDEFDMAITNAFKLRNTEIPIEIDGVTFKAELVKAFPSAVWHAPLKDDLYYPPSMVQAEKIIRNDFGDLRPYVPHRRDCDKFAQKLRVHFWDVYLYNVVVEVWGQSPFGYHSWVLVRCSDGILMVEPQRDSIARIPDILPGYLLEAVHDA